MAETGSVERVTDQLQRRIPRGDYLGWFGSAEISAAADNTIEVAVSNDFAASWIRQKFGEVLADIVHEVCGPAQNIRVVSRETLSVQPAEFGHFVAEEDLGHSLPTATRSTASDPEKSAALPSAVRGRYTFDSFVIGESNRVAHAAALSVAESPAAGFNPLVLHSAGAGGKTHLLHSIHTLLEQRHPGAKVVHLTGELFLMEFVKAVRARGGAVDTFKEHARGAEVFLFDDLHMIDGRAASIQNELAATLMHLIDSGKQVVVTTNTLPDAFHQLEPRLTSILLSGPLITICGADHQTRLGILRRKCREASFAVPDLVLEALAHRSGDNLRRVEGAFTRLQAHCVLTQETPSIAVLDQLFSVTAPQMQQPLTVEAIQLAVCDHFGIDRAALIGRRKSRDVARPRHLAMYLARVMLDLPAAIVGRHFGGRDHSTVLYATERIGNLSQEDPEIADLLSHLIATLRSQGATHRRGIHTNG